MGVLGLLWTFVRSRVEAPFFLYLKRLQEFLKNTQQKTQLKPHDVILC